MKLESNTTYQAPRVDSVITEEELEREIHYAGSTGIVSQSDDGPFRERGPI